MTRVWKNVSVTYCAGKTMLKCIMKEKNMKINLFLAEQVYSTSRFVCHDLEPLVRVRELEIFILISEIVFFTLGSLFTEPSILEHMNIFINLFPIFNQNLIIFESLLDTFCIIPELSQLVSYTSVEKSKQFFPFHFCIEYNIVHNNIHVPYKL